MKKKDRVYKLRLCSEQISILLDLLKVYPHVQDKMHTSQMYSKSDRDLYINDYLAQIDKQVTAMEIDRNVRNRRNAN